ncbi:hypothetical protein Tco_1245304 [Tanacetum coccineum]
MVKEVVTALVQHAMKAPLRARFKDLPTSDMKEILLQRMLEENYDKGHKDHKMAYEALQKSPPSPPPPPPPSGASGASGTTGASNSAQDPPPPPPSSITNREYIAWTTTTSRLKPDASSVPEDVLMHEESDFEAQDMGSDDEDSGSRHILKASALASSFIPPPENSLLSQTGDIGVFIDWFCKKQGITELIPEHLEGPTYEVVKALYPDGDRLALSITKMKAASYPNAGLEQMEYTIAESDFKDLYPSNFEDLYFLNLQGHLNHLPPKDKKILSTAVNLWIRNLVIRKWVEDFQLGIESYQTQLNLTKPRWEATGLEFMHDYKILDSPRAVVFRDKYGMQMIMRFNEIHKFSDGTLQQIDEALDYRVKEFKVNKVNPGLNTRFWTKNDVIKSKQFMFAIQKRLKLRRIFRNLESFVGGRIREGDYRLLQRTE